jgi:hypothetical protein
MTKEEKLNEIENILLVEGFSRLKSEKLAIEILDRVDKTPTREKSSRDKLIDCITSPETVMTFGFILVGLLFLLKDLLK